MLTNELSGEIDVDLDMAGRNKRASRRIAGCDEVAISVSQDRLGFVGRDQLKVFRSQTRPPKTGPQARGQTSLSS